MNKSSVLFRWKNFSFSYFTSSILFQNFYLELIKNIYLFCKNICTVRSVFEKFLRLVFQIEFTEKFLNLFVPLFKISVIFPRVCEYSCPPLWITWFVTSKSSTFSAYLPKFDLLFTQTNKSSKWRKLVSLCYLNSSVIQTDKQSSTS